MSMNLRHKKPINSYRGQANNDKNEFNDDDFKHQPSPAKKLGNCNGEQMYKYSKILAKFIMNANQFYRQKSRHPKKEKSDIQQILEESKVSREQSKNLKTPKKSEQLKQKRKIITKIQNEILQQKQLKQQKQKQCNNIQSQHKINKNIKQIEPQKSNTKNITSKNPSVNTEAPSEKTEQFPKQKTTNGINQNFMNMYSQNIPMNPYANMQIFPSMSMNYLGWSQQQILKMAMFQQMIKNQQQFKGMNYANFNPQFMTNLINNQQLINMRQNYLQNCLRNPLPSLQQLILNKQKPTTAPIHNLTQCYLTKKQSIFNFNKQKPNQIAKKANFHIGIAYHIYLSQKKNTENTDISMLDPTRQSRQIKQRQQNTKKNNKAKTKK